MTNYRFRYVRNEHGRRTSSGYCLPAILLLVSLCAFVPKSGADVVDIVGTENWPTDPLSSTLTGGFITPDLQWTHSYDPIPVENIISATLTIDLIDAESFGQLNVRIGTTSTSPLLGVAQGNDNGTPGPWRPVGDPLAPETQFTIPTTRFSDLADGTFQLYGQNVSMGGWGSNRSRLFIEAIPEPASGIGCVWGLFACTLGRRRRRPMSR